MVPKDLELEWDKKKSRLVKQKHGKSFEEIVKYIAAGKIVAFMRHYNQELYPNQMVIILNVDGYPWVVPCEVRGNKLRLITAFPNRKFKNLIKGERNG